MLRVKRINLAWMAFSSTVRARLCLLPVGAGGVVTLLDGAADGAADGATDGARDGDGTGEGGQESEPSSSMVSPALVVLLLVSAWGAAGRAAGRAAGAALGSAVRGAVCLASGAGTFGAAFGTVACVPGTVGAVLSRAGWLGVTAGAGWLEETAGATPTAGACDGVPSWSCVSDRCIISAFTCCTASALLALDGSIFPTVGLPAGVDSFPVWPKGGAGGADLAAVHFLPLLACSLSVEAGAEPTSRPAVKPSLPLAFSQAFLTFFLRGRRVCPRGPEIFSWDGLLISYDWPLRILSRGVCTPVAEACKAASSSFSVAATVEAPGLAPAPQWPQSRDNTGQVTHLGLGNTG